MGFERSQFGDGTTNVTTDVNNHFGPRETGKTVGNIKTEGGKNELTLDIDAAMVDAGAYALLAPKIPAGSLITAAYAEVTEAFALGGTSPTILVGTETSEVTNGLVINEATAEATGTYDLTATLTGTWGAGLAADTVVGLSLGGTTPSVTTAGKVRVVIEYLQV